MWPSNQRERSQFGHTDPALKQKIRNYKRAIKCLQQAYKARLYVCSRLNENNNRLWNRVQELERENSRLRSDAKQKPATPTRRWVWNWSK